MSIAIGCGGGGAVTRVSMMEIPSITARRNPPNAADRPAEARPYRSVAVQVDPFENPNFETRISCFRFGSRVETRRFRALWVHWIQRVKPPPQLQHAARERAGHDGVPRVFLAPNRHQSAVERRDVAVHVRLEGKGLKPGSHFTGLTLQAQRLEPGAFQAMGQLDSTGTAPPRTTLPRWQSCRRSSAPSCSGTS
jgi:hypothetical protein